MSSPLIARAEQHEYQKLFLHDLNWSRPDQAPVTIEYDGRHVTATNVSQYKGIRVWVVDEKPESKLEAELDRHLARTSTDRIVIFHDEHEQVWRWPVRRAAGNTTTTRLSRHRHRTGDTDPRFADKLDVIRLPFDVTLDSNAVLTKTQHQARDLASLGRPAIIATDADTPGCHAAERDYWLLSQHGLEPARAHLPDGTDPASLLHTCGPDALRRALLTAQPLSRTLINERLDTTLESLSALREAVTVLAAAAPQNWAPGAEHIADRLGLTLTQVRDELARGIYRWQNDPRAGADDALGKADAKRRDQARPTNENRGEEVNLQALRRMHAVQAAHGNQTIRPEDRQNPSLRDDPGLRR